MPSDAERIRGENALRVSSNVTGNVIEIVASPQEPEIVISHEQNRHRYMCGVGEHELNAGYMPRNGLMLTPEIDDAPYLVVRLCLWCRCLYAEKP